jgi:hypothetical protein
MPESVEHIETLLTKTRIQEAAVRWMTGTVE